MSYRITERDLEGLASTLNKLTGNPETDSTKTDDGTFCHNIGHYHIAHDYGRVALEQTLSTSGGVRRILGSGTKRELYQEMHAFLMGLETHYKSERGDTP